MSELKIYSVSDRYIEYLRDFDKSVYSNKADLRIHTRKYVGVVVEINEYKYYIPLSSPKETDYQMAGAGKVIKKSIIPIIRIVVKNHVGEKELKGTLRVSHMIPVPESELELYDIDNEKDIKYRDLVSDEIIFIRKNHKKIISSADIMYKQKTEVATDAGYIKTALDFKRLEKLCEEFKSR